MEKTIFLANFIKKFFVKLPKKMVFFIFNVNLFFNDLCPFLISKLNIIKKFELLKKMKYAQTLVLYSSINIILFMKILIIRKNSFETTLVALIFYSCFSSYLRV